MPVDPSAIATWANLVTVARMFISPVMFIVIPEDGKGSWLALLVCVVLFGAMGVLGELVMRYVQRDLVAHPHVLVHILVG